MSYFVFLLIILNGYSSLDGFGPAAGENWAFWYCSVIAGIKFNFFGIQLVFDEG